MSEQRWPGANRRHFLGSAAGLLFGSLGAANLRADDRPPVTNPRATSGDTIEPKWDERLTITVGPKKADLVGSDEKVLQAAVDYITRIGGGTVQVLPGTYRLRNAVYLQSRVRIGEKVGDVQLADNRIEGYSVAVSDLRRTSTGSPR